MGRVRVGLVLEDIDSFAADIAARHLYGAVQVTGHTPGIRGWGWGARGKEGHDSRVGCVSGRKSKGGPGVSKVACH
jgi:hypothetical protein